MKTDLLARSPLLALPLGALFFFVALYVAAIFLTMRRKAPSYDPLAAMPLDDERGDAK